MHGGKSTGAPVGNKNAVATGEFETIFKDTLTDDENLLFNSVNTDISHQIEQEIRLLEIREHRMLKRIANLRDGKELVITSVEQSEGTNRQLGKFASKSVRLEARLEQIQRIEESLTRVQTQKARLFDLWHKVKSVDGDNVEDWITALEVVEERRMKKRAQSNDL